MAATTASDSAKTPLREADLQAPPASAPSAAAEDAPRPSAHSNESATAQAAGVRAPVSSAACDDIALEWSNVSYTLPPAKKGQPQRVILNNVLGRAEPGQLLAVMGPSGSGKTSLLNVLARRVPVTKGAEVTGAVHIEVGGERINAASVDLPAVSAYVEQDDALFALSTVEETLKMVARLRMASLSQAERMMRVDTVIRLLGLSPARNTVVGSDKPGQRGISGGERKRVHLGIELLHQPRLIFADEPTTGLDSFQAMNVMRALKDLAEAGHTVVCTVHQPRSSIYSMIDKIILLAGGEMAYCGECGLECAKHFASIKHPVPQDFNPADHFLDLISVDYRSSAEEERTQSIVKGVIASCPSVSVDGTIVDRPNAVLPPVLVPRAESRANCWIAFDLLLKRTWRELTRDTATIGMKLVAQIFFTTVFSSIYFQMDMSQTSMQNRTGILFFIAMNNAFGDSIGVSQVVPRQLKVVSRERANKLYSALPFYVATFLCQIPLQMLSQVVYSAIIYQLTGLRPGLDHMLIYIGVVLLESFAGISLGLLLSCAFTEVEQAPQLAPLVVILFLMFSGFLLNQASIPLIYAPLKYISFIRYAFTALAVNEYKGNSNFTCPPRPYPCLQGDDMLKHLDFQDASISWNCMILGLEIAVLNVLALLVLMAKQPKFMQLKPPTATAASNSAV